MSSEFLPVLGIIVGVIAAISAVGWAISYCAELAKASQQQSKENEQRALLLELERRLNENPTARAGYRMLRQEVREVMLQMGVKDVSMTFYA